MFNEGSSSLTGTSGKTPQRNGVGAPNGPTALTNLHASDASMLSIAEVGWNGKMRKAVDLSLDLVHFRISRRG